MKGFCLFSGSKVTNNEEFRKQLQAKNKCLLGLILLGIISAAAAYYMEFWGKMKVDDYMLGVYCGIGVGLICSGIVFLIRNKRLMKDEEKLKEARLQVTDERNWVACVKDGSVCASDCNVFCLSFWRTV